MLCVILSAHFITILKIYFRSLILVCKNVFDDNLESYLLGSESNQIKSFTYPLISYVVINNLVPFILNPDPILSLATLSTFRKRIMIILC